jgi:hypothetical protein
MMMATKTMCVWIVLLLTSALLVTCSSFSSSSVRNRHLEAEAEADDAASASASTGVSENKGESGSDCEDYGGKITLIKSKTNDKEAIIVSADCTRTSVQVTQLAAGSAIVVIEKGIEQILSFPDVAIL